MFAIDYRDWCRAAEAEHEEVVRQLLLEREARAAVAEQPKGVHPPRNAHRFPLLWLRNKAQP